MAGTKAANLLKIELPLEEVQPSGWFYRLSPHLVLRTRRHDQGDAPSPQVLVVESGEAFPPGHPTTRLCLDLLREVLAPGGVHSLLDVGCGSGILGLAGAALGVTRVVGVDICGQAARVTRENARRNLLGDSLMVAQGSTACLKGPFDLVAANLPWEVQMDQVPELDRLATPGSRLLLSGFRDNQEDLLRKSYRQWGWSLRRRLVKDFHHPELPADISLNWVAWLLEKKRPIKTRFSTDTWPAPSSYTEL
jgi:ribosomal protein L11 methylase PrmA